MSEYSSLSDLARFLGQSPASGAAEGRRAVNDIGGAVAVQRPSRQRVSDLLSVVLTLSARTRRMILPKVEVELDVFAPGGERAVRMLLPE
jgi:hypothetical protein